MEQVATSRELRVLMLEDTSTDAELAEYELHKAGIAFTALRVETREGFVRALEEFHPDIILSDYKLPNFNGVAALEIVQRDHPEVPVVMVTGALVDIEAVELIHAGAKDYVLKDRLARLAPAVQRALAAEQSVRERAAAVKALRESEARYKRITEELTDYQYTVRIENGRAVETRQSQASVTVTGYAPEEFVAAPYLWIQMVVPEDRELVREHVRQILSGMNVPPIEHRIIRKDGEIRWICDTTILCKDDSGKLLYYDGVIKDITERKQAEDALARSHAELQRFAEISAHHLQEPARRIATYAERLTTQLAGRLDEAQARLSLEYIGQQARRQQNLLRDIERYLAADQPRGKVGVIDARRTVAEILGNIADRIRETGAEITLGDLPAAHIDAPRLSDVFEVALDNALKFGRGEHPLRIAIAGERHKDRVCYSFSDNGPGIAPEYRERVFRVFERLSSAGEGTGIGLAILRRVAESAGGHAWIEETPGGGCRLVFELPAGVSS